MVFITKTVGLRYLIGEMIAINLNSYLYIVTIQQVLYIRTQRHKETKILFRYKDNKRLESRHKGLQRENFVDFVSSFAAHCIFLQRKNTLYLRVFVFKIIPAE